MSGRLDEIAARLELAHPGPWRLREERIGVWGFVYGPEREEVAHALAYNGWDSAPLIANARADIEWLIGRLR